MAIFKIAQQLVRKAEGEYGKDPRDAGNWTGGSVNSGVLIGTKFGISAPVLSKYLGRTATESDMQNLSYDTALHIYKTDYWDVIKGDLINNQDLANLIYDSSVNEGQGKAKQIVADSLGTNVYDVNKINAANPKKLFQKMGEKREAHYKSLGGYALGSWLTRLKDLGYTGARFARKHWWEIALATVVVGGTAILLIKYRKNIIKGIQKKV